MTTSNYNKRVTIERPVVTRTGTGGASTTWEEVAVVWAAIEPLTARELVLARQVYAQTTHRVRMRWTPVLTPACRLSFPVSYSETRRILNIDGITNANERNAELVISATEAA